MPNHLSAKRETLSILGVLGAGLGIAIVLVIATMQRKVPSRVGFVIAILLGVLLIAGGAALVVRWKIGAFIVGGVSVLFAAFTIFGVLSCGECTLGVLAANICIALASLGPAAVLLWCRSALR